MADGKNSIIVYRDWKKIFDELTDEEAGRLIKHFFSYVNDEDPELKDKYLKMAFLPIKSSLQRDLKHWESVKERRSESGRLGGLRSAESRSKNNQNEANEANASTTKQNEANEAVSVSVIDSVTVKDNKESNANKLAERSKRFYESIQPFISTYKKEMLRAFFDYWSEPNKSNTKMKFELEKTWDVQRRLKTWADRETTFNKNKLQQNDTKHQPAAPYFKPIRFSEGE